MGEGGIYSFGYMGETSTSVVFSSITDGIIKGWELFGDIADFLVIDDIKTVADPNSSYFDKGLAAAGFVPWGKLIRGGKLIVQLGNKEGKYIERATELTDDSWKAAANLACNCFVAGKMARKKRIMGAVKKCLA